MVSHNQAALLGMPVGNTELIDVTISLSAEKLKLMRERLSYLSSHDALPLLCHSFAILKLASAASYSTLLQQIVPPPALICHNLHVDSALRIFGVVQMVILSLLFLCLIHYVSAIGMLPILKQPSMLC